MRYYHVLFLVFISFVLYSCGKKSDLNYWNDAVKLQKDGKNKEAAEIYTELADKYPNSPNAPKSLFEAGKIYHSKNVKGISENDALQKAIVLYRRLYDSYPGSEQAPEALFMVGFIESNELRNFPEATRAFRTFLEKYPQHEMASSAQSELETMGLTPEEIITKKMQSVK